MTRQLLRTLPAVALSLTVAGTALAQPPAAPPPPRDPAAPAVPQQAYRAKQVIGAKVSLQDSFSIGIVDDIVFDEAGQVEYLVVNNEGKLVTVPWSAARFTAAATAAPTAVINITRDQYRAIPTFTVTTYPNFYAPAYRTEVYRYYGLTPGQLRRIDRQIDRNNDRNNDRRP